MNWTDQLMIQVHDKRRLLSARTIWEWQYEKINTLQLGHNCTVN